MRQNRNGGEILYDSITIQSPFISEETACVLANLCEKRMGFFIPTGEVIYDYTSGQLEGSFDSRISIQIQREKLQDDIIDHLRTGEKKMVMKECKPFIRLSCSIHKVLLGHNVYGGTDDLLSAVRWLINTIETQAGLSIKDRLPRCEEWEVYRIDYTKVFDLGSFEAVNEWLRSMKFCTYPRRDPLFFKEETVMFSGRNTVLKCYHKGPEFYKHDRKRLLKHMKHSEVDELQNLANNILRVEVGIRSKKLKEDFGNMPKVINITKEYVEEVYRKEVSKLVREAKRESEIYRTAEAVQQRLYQVYTEKQAGVLLGTWFQMATMGEKNVKQKMKKPTFYRHRKMLVDSGCSWLQTDVVLKEYTLIPMGFVPVVTDSRCLNVTHKIILEKLGAVA